MNRRQHNLSPNGNDKQKQNSPCQPLWLKLVVLVPHAPHGEVVGMTWIYLCVNLFVEKIKLRWKERGMTVITG